MKVGLFFGSFNPIHNGHLVIAEFMATQTDLDEVWFVVSPHNPLKNKKSLANDYDRLAWVQDAIVDNPKLKASSIEFTLPQPSYTIDTLMHLKERYPEHEFSLIMGSDNLKSLKKWKNYTLILRDYPIYVYPRPGDLNEEWLNHPNITFTKTPLMEISASFIRSAIAAEKSVKFFLPDRVISFIENKSLYK